MPRKAKARKTAPATRRPPAASLALVKAVVNTLIDTVEHFALELKATAHHRSYQAFREPEDREAASEATKAVIRAECAEEIRKLLESNRHTALDLVTVQELAGRK